VIAAVLLIGLTGGLYYWLRPARAVPEVPLGGQDVEVVNKVKEFRDAVVKAPRSAEAWGSLGRVLLVNEISPDVALVCFEEAERLDPDNPRWPYFIGGLLTAEPNRLEEAVSKLERAVELAEQASNAPSTPRLFLAETLASLGRAEEAEGHFKKVLAVDSINPRAHFGLGLLAYARGDWPACRAFLEACRDNPQAQKKAYLQLATVCERLNDHDIAAKYAALAARLPKDADWFDPYVFEHLDLAVRARDRYRKVETLEAQGHFESAANYLRPLLLEYPNDYNPHLMMGRIQGQLGNSESAEFHLLKARQMAPDVIQVHYLLSLVLGKKGEAVLAQGGDPAKAKKLFEESARSARAALALRPDYGRAHMSLGLALKQLGKPAEALAAFREAVHCSPEFGENHLFLGQALAEANDVEGARHHLQQAQLMMNPNDLRLKAALDKLPPAKKSTK
jgi:tetratricopeptide (TPR) repeat protein